MIFRGLSAGIVSKRRLLSRLLLLSYHDLCCLLLFLAGELLGLKIRRAEPVHFIDGIGYFPLVFINSDD